MYLLVDVVKAPGGMSPESRPFASSAELPGVHEVLQALGVDWPRTPLNLSVLLALVALLLGLFAVGVTPREEEPQINVTMANVLIPFPGASSEDVQAMVARPAEQVLSQIADIDHTYSVAQPGMAVLTVQFASWPLRTVTVVPSAHPRAGTRYASRSSIWSKSAPGAAASPGLMRSGP